MQLLMIDCMKKEIILAAGKILLLEGKNGSLVLPDAGEIEVNHDAEIFEFGDYIVSSASDPAMVQRDQLVEMGVREAYRFLPADVYGAVVKGAELVNWNAEERFCCKCGSPLIRHTNISKRCQECGSEYFPRLSPAIVVLVKKGEAALLVHAKNFKHPKTMALVAGFVETGESLEECVAREIKEETDIKVGKIRYVGSQSWPFPHQLMLGFTAEYVSGEVKFADGELSAGGFFTKDNVPELPTPPSLSRDIIDRWLRGEL